MTLLLNCQNLSKSFGTKVLFHELSLSIFAKDKIGLIGANGSGKSTLLKILASIELPDHGTVSLKRGLKIGYVPQVSEFELLEPEAILLETLKQDTEKTEFEKELLVKTWLSKLGFNGSEPKASLLSGGWKKRLAIANVMVLSPDVLFLDEPTNHLDLEGLLWLEKFLAKNVLTYLLVSHDRYFLQNATNKIVEIDPVYPEGLFLVDGPYAEFLAKKNEFLEGQLTQERSIASKARREEEWLSKTAKARTKKSISRIDEANQILDELEDIRKRNSQKRVQIDFAASDRETRKLIVCTNISKQIKERLLFQHLDFTLSPKTRIGLIGPNGSGKTTLLRLLAGEILPDQGTIKQADDLKIVYFDQHRAKLSPDITLRQALSPTGDFVTFRGKPVHVNGWCKRFLFSPDILDMPIGILSGGERARIAIAHLLLKPADILLLDEPTNDLDIATLETLEESLMDFPGAIVLITHDRCMIDRICNSILALGDINNTAIYADYAQWQECQKKIEKEEKPKEIKQESTPKKIKLTYLEKQEYDQIEGKILKLETEVKKLNLLLEDASVIENSDKLQEVCAAIHIADNEIERLYIRWEELEKKLK
ncbi:MAG: ABC-F family ATP-binding cassette domain-containing protein [Chlamydiae bacterium]|nr:ABC-F family ATP-binding cassette domain-containing protein [Chlamydiota bacterium]